MDAVSRYVRTVLAASAIIVAGAVAAGPLWAWGRPDRLLGFALGTAASLVRFGWSVRLARTFSWSTPRRYAAARTAGLVIPGAALATAALTGQIDLAATAAGVFVATAASVAAGLWVTRTATGGEIPPPA